MQVTTVRKLIYLNSRQTLPAYLEAVENVHWNFVQNAKELKEFISSDRGDVIVVVKAEYLSQRSLEGFAKWGESKPRLSFIFIVQAMENAAFQMSLDNDQLLFIYESEGERISDLLTRRLQGLPVKSRKQERIAVQSQIMLKKAATIDSPRANSVQFLKEGEMQDFSAGGARISVGSAGVQVKDFVSLMYRNRHGQWVSVDSQVRWVVPTAGGDQMIGVQFLAVSA